MSQPEPRLAPAPPPGYSEESAIGEVRALVFDWRPGQSEVRVRLPDNALPGVPGAAAKQDEFRRLVLAELEQVLKTLGKPG